MCETTDAIKQYALNGYTRKEIAALLGISGKSLKDIISVTKVDAPHKRGEVYTVRGFTGSVQDIAQHFDLKLSVTGLYVRLKKMGEADLESVFFSEAMTKGGRPSPSRYKYYTVRGFYGTRLEINAKFGLSIERGLLNRRIASGKSVEEAFFTPLGEFTNYGVVEKYTVDGITGTIRELYEHFKPERTLKTVWEQKRRGQDLESLLKTPLKKGNTRAYRLAQESDGALSASVQY